MEATRERHGILILSLISGIILEVITKKFIKYNVCTEIISLILYCSILVYIITCIYYLRKDDDLYYKYSLIRYVMVLLALILVFYVLANISNIKLLVMGISVLTILVFLAIKFSEKANKYKQFKFDERD